MVTKRAGAGAPVARMISVLMTSALLTAALAAMPAVGVANDGFAAGTDEPGGSGEVPGPDGPEDPGRPADEIVKVSMCMSAPIAGKRDGVDYYATHDLRAIVEVEGPGFDIAKATVNGLSNAAWERDGETWRTEVDCSSAATLILRWGDAETSVFRYGDLGTVDASGGEVGGPRFCADATAPVASVSFEGGAASNGAYYNEPRRATVTVEETSFASDLIELETTGEACPWREVSPGVHEATVEFSVDGEHYLRLGGRDLAGNELSARRSDGSLAAGYDSGLFFVDEVAPEISIELDKEGANSRDGVDYYNDAPTAAVTVSDANLDPESVQMEVAGGEVEGDWAERDDGALECRVRFSEGTDKGIKLRARDLAGNEATAEAGPFAVDLAAPQVTAASMSADPARAWATGRWFYDGEARLLVEVEDDFSLESVSVIDPDGFYDFDDALDEPLLGPAARRCVEIPLLEGRPLSRGVVVRARDLAHNERIWSIAPTGAVHELGEREEANLPIDGAGDYPEALTRDTTAPGLSLSGPAEGSFLSSAQEIALTVEEAGLPYLKVCDPDQRVLTVSREDGGAVESWSRPVSQLSLQQEGQGVAGDLYGMSETLTKDGRYSVEAGLADPAGNVGQASLGEFTIDATPPVLAVSFDNEDAHNEKYYSAPRTATVEVAEHNFDPSLVSIETTGEVSPWSTSGDIHGCTVLFSAEGTHSLSVSGTDKAGNAMEPFSAGEFVVDATPPTVLVAGVEDGHAYNGDVAPSASAADETGLDLPSTSFALLDAEGNEVSQPASVEGAGRSVETLFPGFRHTPENDGIYTLKASAVDLAGNATEMAVTFSVNRYGSTFRVLDPDALKANDGYLPEAPEVSIEEVNVSAPELEDCRATITHGVESRELGQGDAGSQQGFFVEEAENSRGPGTWASRVYRVPAGNFDADGPYQVTVSSRDRAENLNSSESFFDRASGSAAAARAAFVLDTTDPQIRELSVHEGAALEEADLEASFLVAENIGLASVVVSVDGEQVPVSADEFGMHRFSVPRREGKRSLRIVATDLAGRTAEAEVRSFMTPARQEAPLPEHPYVLITIGAVIALAAPLAVAHTLQRRRQQ